jgi:sodium bicarbonate transporter 10
MRTNQLFGGVINDLKQRFPWYLSDFRDGLSSQCLAATIFIYFACLSGAVAFGGITGNLTAARVITSALGEGKLDWCLSRSG